MARDKKNPTVADLKAALEKVPPERLNDPIFWTGEERGAEVVSIEVLTEALVDFEGDGLEEASGYGEAEIKEANIYLPAGTLLLSIE